MPVDKTSLDGQLASLTPPLSHDKSTAPKVYYGILKTEEGSGRYELIPELAKTLEDANSKAWGIAMRVFRTWGKNIYEDFLFPCEIKVDVTFTEDDRINIKMECDGDGIE